MKLLKALNKVFWLISQPEIYIISYPKTGRTWLRVLIGKTLSDMNRLPEEKILQTEFMTKASGLPRVTLTHDGSAMIKHKHYTELSSDKKKYRNKKVLLLGRDIKDTLVSAYFQATKRINVFDGTISEFIRNERYGAIKFITFYTQWYENRNVPQDFLFVSYEDMSADTGKVLDRVLKFLGASHITDVHIQEAVNYSSFEKLKKAEQENRFNSGMLSPGKTEDPESFKIRKGKVGNYNEYLPSDDIEYIDALLTKSGFDFSKFQT